MLHREDVEQYDSGSHDGTSDYARVIVKDWTTKRVLYNSTVSALSEGSETALCVQLTLNTRNFFKSISDKAFLSYDGENGIYVNEVQFRAFNAFYDDGEVTFGSGFVVADIVAHEWTHGYTEHTSDLVYAYQSGAINEAVSDM